MLLRLNLGRWLQSFLLMNEFDSEFIPNVRLILVRDELRVHLGDGLINGHGLSLRVLLVWTKGHQVAILFII
jgi:hypothetical protein